MHLQRTHQVTHLVLRGLLLPQWLQHNDQIWLVNSWIFSITLLSWMLSSRLSIIFTIWATLAKKFCHLIVFLIGKASKSLRSDCNLWRQLCHFLETLVAKMYGKQNIPRLMKIQGHIDSVQSFFRFFLYFCLVIPASRTSISGVLRIRILDYIPKIVRNGEDTALIIIMLAFKNWDFAWRILEHV